MVWLLVMSIHYLPENQVIITPVHTFFFLETFKLCPCFGFLCKLKIPLIWSHDSSVLVLRALVSIRETKANPSKSSTTAFFLLQVEVDRSRASTTLKDLSSQTPYTVSVSAVYDEGESPPASAYETTRELCPVSWTHRKYLTFLQISTY